LFCCNKVIRQFNCHLKLHRFFHFAQKRIQPIKWWSGSRSCRTYWEVKKVGLNVKTSLGIVENNYETHKTSGNKIFCVY
jgi:hypothetical protein